MKNHIIEYDLIDDDSDDDNDRNCDDDDDIIMMMIMIMQLGREIEEGEGPFEYHL